MFIAAESCVISSFAIATDSLSTECNIPDAPRDSWKQIDNQKYLSDS